MTAPLTPSLRAMLERIDRYSGSLLLLSVIASGRGDEAKLNKLRAAGYVVKCEHPIVTDRRFGGPAEALAITEAGKQALEASDSAAS